MTATGSVPSLEASAVRVGDELTPVQLDVTFSRVATLAAGTWDVFPGHHDRAYAQAQGQKDIYLNTMQLSGFVDRVALGWSGPGWFLRRRKLRIIGSVYPGDVLTGRGRVTAVDQLGENRWEVVVVVEASTGDGPAVAAEITLVHGLATEGQA